jgi:hypothetical protein
MTISAQLLRCYEAVERVLQEASREGMNTIIRILSGFGLCIVTTGGERGIRVMRYDFICRALEGENSALSTQCEDCSFVVNIKYKRNSVLVIVRLFSVNC